MELRVDWHFPAQLYKELSQAFTVALATPLRMACNHGHGSYPELNYGSGAKWIKNLTKDRLGGFTGGRFSDLNLSSVLYTHRLDNQEFVKLKV